VTTYTIDDTSAGTVIGGPGAVTRIEVVTLPDRGENQTIGAFALADNSGPNPRQIHNCESDNIARLVGALIGTDSGRVGIGPVMSTTPIPFGSLLIQAVPRGAAFELTVN
jgi:hypothetical protein